MSGIGAPEIGGSPSYSVDTSLGTTIVRYAVVQFNTGATTTNVMEVGLCNTSGTNRALAVGVAYTKYPKDPQVYSVTTNPSVDISDYEPAQKNILAIKENGFSWILIGIPSGGSNITSIHAGIEMVPSDVYAGGVMPIPAMTMTSATDVATITTAYVADTNEVKNRFAVAHSPVHVPAITGGWGGRPAIGQGTIATTLTALTNAATYGFVYCKLVKR